MSNLDECIDSKPNNNTEMHFEKTSCKVTSSGAVRPTFPKMALTERKNDFLCYLTFDRIIATHFPEFVC